MLRRLGWVVAIPASAFGLAVAAMAWHGRQTVDLWWVGTPNRWTVIHVSPRLFVVETWNRNERDRAPFADAVWQHTPYWLLHNDTSRSDQLRSVKSVQQYAVSGWSWDDLGWVHGLRRPPIPSAVLFYLPTWAVVVPTILPLAVLIALWVWRRKRVTPGVCRTCGHDLRATAGQCPKCGAIAVAGRRGP